mmetsp:Transcript_145432/g.451093  ORF Transcript_145432/g.451093 Transcript_145432/m.451093 type:complete len:372 (+) Transcript_145432:94-1209(+)
MTKRKADALLPDTSCFTFRLCSDFVRDHLVGACGVKRAYLDQQGDKCFCRRCEPNAGRLFHRGQPPERYVLPENWCRFGVAVNERFAEAEDVWSTWHVGFHGTSDGHLAAILRHGQLLLPGDVLDDGTELRIRDGHHRDEIAYFTSPTIKYSELSAYATPVRWRGFEARIVLQLRQRPGSYRTQPETVGWSARNQYHRIDPHFSNREVERRSRARGAVLIYGILVKIDPCRSPSAAPAVPPPLPDLPAVLPRAAGGSHWAPGRRLVPERLLPPWRAWGARWALSAISSFAAPATPALGLRTVGGREELEAWEEDWEGGVSGARGARRARGARGWGSRSPEEDSEYSWEDSASSSGDWWDDSRSEDSRDSRT